MLGFLVRKVRIIIPIAPSAIMNNKHPNTTREEQMLHQGGVLSTLAPTSKMPDK